MESERSFEKQWFIVMALLTTTHFLALSGKFNQSLLFLSNLLVIFPNSLYYLLNDGVVKTPSVFIFSLVVLLANSTIAFLVVRCLNVIPIALRTAIAVVVLGIFGFASIYIYLTIPGPPGAANSGDTILIMKLALN
jgi:hypothetical protein